MLKGWIYSCYSWQEPQIQAEGTIRVQIAFKMRKIAKITKIMGRGLDRKEVVRNLRILPSTEQANKYFRGWMTEWMGGWMNMRRLCFRPPHYFDLLCLAKYFSLLYSMIFMSSLSCLFKKYLSASLSIHLLMGT